MRWFWIDRFTEFESGVRAVALKNCTTAEDHVHDLFPNFPIVPNSLLVEGFAQTGGMLVGESRNFTEKVILAKIGRATFRKLVRPGQTVLFHANVDQLNETGASVSGTITVDGETVAEIEMMFSHIDQNFSGAKFPEHNFVFTQTFIDLLRPFRTVTL